MEKSMKTKNLPVAIMMLLVVGGLWFWRTHSSHSSNMGVGLEKPDGQSRPGEKPNRFAPPDPNRKFRELTPEQRVQRARQGPIGG